MDTELASIATASARLEASAKQATVDALAGVELAVANVTSLFPHSSPASWDVNWDDYCFPTVVTPDAVRLLHGPHELTSMNYMIRYPGPTDMQRLCVPEVPLITAECSCCVNLQRFPREGCNSPDQTCSPLHT
jgi:hypothetical protein